MTSDQPSPAGDPAGPASGDALRLRLAVVRLQRRIRTNSHDGIPPLQLSALSRIAAIEPVQLTELARHEQVSVATMCRAVEALGKRGFVSRSTHPGDARRVQLTVTESGRALLRTVSAHNTAYLARKLGRLGASDRSALRAALPILELLVTDPAIVDEPAPARISAGPITDV